VRRREFIAGLGTAAATLPLAAGAQQSDRVRRIGILLRFPESDPDGQARIASFRQRLQRLGWKDGDNIRIDEHWVAVDLGRIGEYAEDLVNSRPDVIVLTAARMVPILQEATSAIPIVFVEVNNVVAAGFVASLARPGGNVTGFSSFEPSVVGKLLEALKRIAPRVTRVAHLFDPDNPISRTYYRSFEAAASSLGVAAIAAPIHDAGEIERAIAMFAYEPNGALLMPPDTITITHRELIIALAVRHRLPSVSWNRIYVVDGGLISYGASAIDLYRLSAGYVDRILKGEKPANLPIQLPVKFEMAINVKAAEALGLPIPETLLATADEVIQ
jgi:putative tryptophan/tyrosine transport system substrate-binding protein